MEIIFCCFLGADFLAVGGLIGCGFPNILKNGEGGGGGGEGVGRGEGEISSRGGGEELIDEGD